MSAGPDIRAMHAQAELIETQAAHIRILLGAIFEHLDSMQGLPPAMAKSMDAINCFATCALRNAALIQEEAVSIYLEGGAA